MWTTAKDLKAQLARLWDRGELLRDAVTGNQRFPLRLKLKGPTSADITARFEAVRAWVAELSATRSLRLEYQDVRHRVQGMQRLPQEAWLDSLDNALAWLDKVRDWDRFTALLNQTRQACPAALPWLAKRPHQALELTKEWPDLLVIVNWISEHPLPKIYLRQVDIPGIHSKFIECHRAVLTELLDLVLPGDCVDIRKIGVHQFACRYGFLEKPTRIRFRLLDPKTAAVAGTRCADVTLDRHSFSQLTVNVRRVIITENEINFLTLPTLADTIAIFGAGYGWEALAQARWLEQPALHYWGDIDTHGFAILNQLRGHFPQVHSLLMDQATLEAHQPFWGREEKPHQGDLRRLTDDESALYHLLRDNRIRPGLRLEQERIGYHWVQARLNHLF